MRLELGSGQRPTEGFTHLDVRPDWPDVDIVDDAATLDSIPDASCEVIRACHLLEHFGHRDTIPILELWRSKLVPGGVLYVEVPNIQGHFNAWARGEESTDQLAEYLYGDQDYPENTHRTGFTEPSLGLALRRAGFRAVRTVDFGLACAANGVR